MNMIMLSGRVCNLPHLSILHMEERKIFCCKFVLGVESGRFEEDSGDEKKVDFFECVAFEHTADMIGKHFTKGSKMMLSGYARNHIYKDINDTAHFTNIILAQQVEFGDSASAVENLLTKKASADISIVSDLKEMDRLFQEVCNHGYLCIDENDYYQIAMKNFEVISDDAVTGSARR